VFALSSVLATVIILNLKVRPDSPPLLLYGGMLLSMLGGMAMGMALNVGVELAAFRPFRRTSRLAPLIATLGLSFILYQVSLLWRYVLPSWVLNDHRSVPGMPEVPIDRIPDLAPTDNLIERLGLDWPIAIETKSVIMWLVTIAIAISASYVLRRMPLGREMRAVSQNPELARLCGINVDRTITKAFALGGLLAGAAAYIFVWHYARPYGSHGAQSGLIAFSAALMGGVGSPLGALASGFSLGVVQSLSDFYLSTAWTPVLVYGLLIILLVLRPAGLVAGAADDVGTSARDAVTVLYRGAQRPWVRWLWVAALAAAALYPLAQPYLGVSREGTFTVVMIFIMLALGLTVLLGFAGLLDLGYAISFGIGGYAAALLTDPYGKLRAALGITGQIDFVVVLAVAAIAAGLFGLLNAVLTFRMRADYLAIVTLAYGLMIRQLLVIFSDVTGGNQGISGLPPPVMLGVPLESPQARYYLALALVALTAIAVQRLVQSRAGRAFMAMGEDELASASSGVNVNAYKGAAFVVGTAIAGIAGALYASSVTLVDPDMGDFRISMMVLAMVIVSGAGSVPGAIIGAVLISLYDRIAIPALGEWIAQQTNGAFDIRQLSYLTFGLAVYLTVLARARGRRNV
jgi:branched-chain amino acid transport system permease protein